MDTTTKFKNVFKWISFCILIIVSTTPLLTLIAQGVSSETLITDKIYGLNCTLCVVSIIVMIIYFIGLYFLKLDGTSRTYKEKKDIKAYLKNTWPCLLLVIFMCWTAVGCIQASMEAAAETALKDDIATNDTERNKEIAAWSSGDRMSNAGDRAWNGCNNLKDGYFSFLFYGTVLINVIMLGKNSDNLKKWLLRVLLISAFILVFFSFLSLIDSNFLNGMVKYNRAIFNNSNHYGYYLCISTVLAAMMFIKEKNIYFKIMALLSFALMMFELIINNTFGAYLGVATAIIIVAVISLIKLIVSFCSSKKVEGKEFLKVLVVTVIFAVFTCITAGAEVKTFKTKDGNEKISSTIYLKVGDKNYNISHDTIYMKAEETKYKVAGNFEIKTVEGDRKSKVQGNFEQLGKDIITYFDSFNKDKETEEDVKEKTENKSGLTEEVSKIGSGRGEVWIKSLDLIKQRPVFGWGLENLLNEFYYQYGINEGRTHNLILQLAGTTGVVGMLLYMVAVIAIFFKVCSHYKNWGTIEYITLPVFIAYMVSSMFGNSAFYTSPYFMIILGMMIASMIFYDKEKVEKTIQERSETNGK